MAHTPALYATAAGARARAGSRASRGDRARRFARRGLGRRAGRRAVGVRVEEARHLGVVVAELYAGNATPVR